MNLIEFFVQEIELMNWRVNRMNKAFKAKQRITTLCRGCLCEDVSNFISKYPQFSKPDVEYTKEQIDYFNRADNFNRMNSLGARLVNELESK